VVQPGYATYSMLQRTGGNAGPGNYARDENGQASAVPPVSGPFLRTWHYGDSGVRDAWGIKHK
jgi:hypothetical protein